MRERYACVFVVASLSSAAFAAGGQGLAPYDHLSGTPRIYSADVGGGETISLAIENTCAQRFSYEVVGILRAPSPPPPNLTALVVADPLPNDACLLGTQTVEWKHDAKWGGYFIHVVKKDSSPVFAVRPDHKAEDIARIKDHPESALTLKPVTLVVQVPGNPWNVELAGAFTTSLLTDPVYGLQTRQVDGEDVDFLIRDEEAEDSVRLGVASFLHVSHSKLPFAAFTFGLGITQDSKTSYYVGATWRMGGKAALTGGYNWGPIVRLPAGARVDQPAPANALANLGTRTSGAWFFGISFAFLGSDAGLKKPFAGGPEK